MMRKTLPLLNIWCGSVLSALCLAACVLGLGGLGGCVSDKVTNGTTLAAYQEKLAREGPQKRESMEGEEPSEALGLLKPVPPEEKLTPDLQITVDPNTGKKRVSLTIDQAILRALANSPEIRVVSFDPEIARQDVRRAAAAFDPNAFGRVFYEDQDAPSNSIFEPGRAISRLFESGVRQRLVQGTEWSASYALSRNWDDLYRTIPTRYEPMLVFQLKQPLLRDADPAVNLAGVDIARLGHRVALIGFHDKAESVSAELIAGYWRLVQARTNLEIQRELVKETLDTLHKVDSRREIDATDVQLMQARAYARIREADLREVEKQLVDAQDAVARLLADPQINTTSDLTIVPATMPQTPQEPPELTTVLNTALTTAMLCNPAVQEAKIRIQIAEINMQVAENQKMPRLDLVGSVRGQGLAKGISAAQEQLEEGQYMTYSVGLTFEYPLGNRARDAELMRRRLERRKAVSVLHSAADQVAAQVREKARKVETTMEETVLQREAARAAQVQLKALEESEPIREKLTPEFLLVKLQAQDTYAQTRRAEASALADFNISQVELARVTGTVLRMHRVENALATVTEDLPAGDQAEKKEGEQEIEKGLPELTPSGFLYSRPAKDK
jgi:outer membrane protein TolC